MEEIKNAVSRLEDAVLDLESVAHQIKRAYAQATERNDVLKNAVKEAYTRIDDMLTAFKQGDE